MPTRRWGSTPFGGGAAYNRDAGDDGGCRRVYMLATMMVSEGSVLAQTLAANALAYRELYSAAPTTAAMEGSLREGEEETRADGRADDGGKVAERWRG